MSGGGAEGEELFGVVWCGEVCGCRGVVSVWCGVLRRMSVERREKGVSGWVVKAWALSWGFFGESMASRVRRGSGTISWGCRRWPQHPYRANLHACRQDARVAHCSVKQADRYMDRLLLRHSELIYIYIHAVIHA